MSNFLHKLINSLTRSEKIYFKRYAQTHAKNENKNYLDIYKSIDQINTTGNGLQDKFKGTTIEKYFHSEVYYLKEKLLLSLFNFNLNSSKRNQIQKGILLADVLTKKGFQREALKKITSVKKKATKYEEFTMLLQIIELEEVILFKEGVIGYKDQLQDLKEQRAIVTSKIENLNDYHILREEMREFQFTIHQDASNSASFQKIFNNPLIESSDGCLSVKAKEHWFYTQVLSNYLLRNFRKGLIIASEYVKFMEVNSHLFSDSKMLPVLSNYIYHAALTNDKRHFELGQYILNEVSKKGDISDSYFQYIHLSRNIEYAYYADDKLFMKQQLPIIVNLLSENSENFEDAQIQYLFMLIVRSAVFLEMNNMGSEYTNMWLQHGVLPYRKVQARLFSIMIHYKLGYMRLLQSEIVILKKMEKEFPSLQSLIRSFYNFINILLKYPNKENELIKSFQNDIKMCTEQNKRLIEHVSFDYYRWSLSLVPYKIESETLRK
jgi:hypothetical protein